MELNSSDVWSNVEMWMTAEYPIDYRVIATMTHVLIFLCGVVGNVVVIVVVSRTKNLQSPTYTYLVSLAYADLLVLISAVPEAVLVYHIGNRWILGQVGCSIFIFANFLGINAGSLFILAFTIEQYVSFCGRGKYTQAFSSNPKAVVVILWIAITLYCAPWLVLTEVRADQIEPEVMRCEMRLSREVYLAYFGSDLTLFYVIPLVTAVVCYSKIGKFLLRNRSYLRQQTQQRGSFVEHMQAFSTPNTELSEWTYGGLALSSFKARVPRKQVLRMLVVVVIIFALAWLPFRGLLVYNCFVATPWLEMWFLFFAKTLIYLNSAMNPFLYSLMSQRFRLAVRRLFGSRKRGCRADQTASSRRSQQTAILSRDWLLGTH